jgi:hypothetical protein
MPFRRLLILIPITLLPISLVFADPVVPNDKGFIEISGENDLGKVLFVRISLRHPNQDDQVAAHIQKLEGLDPDWWGAFDGPPDHIIATFEVRVGNNYVAMFRSAYSDLGDVKSAELEVMKSSFNVTIHGGQTGTGYVAVLNFRGGNLVGRKVTHNEMGLGEETNYTVVPDN